MASAVSLLLLSPPRQLHRDGTSRLLSTPHRRVLLAAPTNATPRRLLAAAPRASNNNDNSGAMKAPDRLVAAVAYLYPFLDGTHHGRFLLAQFPFFRAVLRPLAPAARIFHSSPLTPFLLFLTLYFAVVRNQQSFSRFVRFNAMQAVVLDVLLIFPDLLAQSFAPPSGGVGFEVFQSMESTVFLFLLVSLVYGGGACLLGKTPRLPIVADAAERQVM
ncbi:protein TIC 20-v, chloroplastic-like [Miscanthus floridulus]|uniref:protein TIC 20-v, chloroplastic-like n=1 Tax=Miscanthus floridulus TaxID=154761 RepID=UPI00345780BB